MKDFAPHIGKNVIETLTAGMYENPLFVYREYVQNAADQIDVALEEELLSKRLDGKIEINIDKESKTIVVEDNATGISSKNVLRFLGDIANSSKDREKRKGFRGIGRLGGLGYCDRLVFETSAAGENVKSIMSLDAKLLNDIILDNNNISNASEVISIITSLAEQDEFEDRHYFKITLQNVNTVLLLEEDKVIDYLSMVAPLPFSQEFKFTNEIKTYFKKRNASLDEYVVKVNGKQIFKGYKNSFIDEKDKTVTELVAVDFFDVIDIEGNLLAVGWFGFRNLSNFELPDSTLERGIRVRKNNIALGNEITLSRFFKSARTNLRFIGEVHVLGNSFIPNARRDYFNENKTLRDFEVELQQIFKGQNLENRIAQTASNLYNRIREIEAYQAAQKEYEGMKGKFASETEEKRFVDDLSDASAKAKRAVDIITKIQSKTKTDRTVGKLVNVIVSDRNLDLPEFKRNIDKYNPPKFSKLSPEQEKIAVEILEIVDQTLSPGEAKKVRIKIVEKYN